MIKYFESLEKYPNVLRFIVIILFIIINLFLIYFVDLFNVITDFVDVNKTISIKDTPFQSNVKVFLFFVINLCLIYMFINTYIQEYIGLRKYKESIIRDNIKITEEIIENSKTKFTHIDTYFDKAIPDKNALLDYISYFKLLPSGDIIYKEKVIENFENKLEKELIEASSKQQVNKYRCTATSLRRILDEINNEFEPLEQQTLIRSVFDVEKGGVFFYNNENKLEFIFGTTITQEFMCDDTADNQMRILFNQIFNKEI